MRPGFLLLLSLVACAGRAQPTVRARDYYPWAVGTTWVYQANYLGRVETRTVVLGPMKDGFYVDDAGGKLAYDKEGIRDDRRYLLRAPIQAGTKWHSVSAAGASEDYEIVRAHEPCSTKAGKWDDCVQVKSTMPAANDRMLENVMTFAKGIGLVRVATTLRRGEERVPQVELELVGFRAR